MTILDACVTVLKDHGDAMHAKDILNEINQKNLFTFKAKDPLGMLKSTLRKHLRKDGPHRVEQIKSGTFKAN